MTDSGEVNPYTRTLAWVCAKVTRNDLLDPYRKYVEVELGKK
jgi:hypothetical protein